MSLVKRTKIRAGYLALRFLSLLCQAKWSWLTRLGAALLGDLAWFLPTKLRRNGLSNLRNAFSLQMTEAEIRRICRTNFRFFAKSLLEFLSCPYLTREEIRQRVELRGRKFLRSALEEGKGVILLTANFGNWEWLGARVSAEGFPLTSVVRRHSDPATEALRESIRRHNGTKTISREDTRAALRCLRDKQILLILADQHGGPAGIRVPFLGRPASFFPGIALLALHTRAPVISAFAVRKRDDSHAATVYPPLELAAAPNSQECIRANTSLFKTVIEEKIRQHPDHWIWFQDRWRS